MNLSPQQVEQFWQDGFLIVENLLDEQALTTLRERAEWVATGQASHIDRQRLQVEPGVAAGEASAATYNGCLWMLSGTHRFGVIDKAQWEEYEQLSLAGQLSVERPIELKAGSCSFHHGLILHCSRLNLSDRRRRSYATHYVSAHCRYTGDPAQNDALLVRGSSQPGCI